MNEPHTIQDVINTVNEKLLVQYGGYSFYPGDKVTVTVTVNAFKNTMEEKESTDATHN